jgi:hypothetical protein
MQALYPTPILDWTYSPFVAAYFAFKDLRKDNLGAQDLALMGITAGSLFPGLDGACLQLKERYFDL